MMSEEKDLQAKIAALSGKINLHKQHNQDSIPYSLTSQVHGRGSAQWMPKRGTPYGYARGRARNAVANHRNRTLIMNNSVSKPDEVTGVKLVGSETRNDTMNQVQSPTNAGSWVSKRDRHMQLINTSVYDRVSQERVRSMEATNDSRQRQRSDIEKVRLKRHFQSLANSSSSADKASSSLATREIEINCIRFRLTDGGSKLMRVSDDPNTARATPKRTKVAGITFIRSKNGNLYRSGLIKNKKVSAMKKSNQLCPRFTSTGTCSNGPDCRFMHDFDKIAICKTFLQKGTCPLGEACDLSHEPTPNRVPACLHFLRGNCTNEQCRYTHVHVNPAAPVCRNFATLGFCEKGSTCAERHVFECPDYANRGTCRNSKCRLPHVDRAGQIRKVAAAAAAAVEAKGDGGISTDENAGEAASDLSSDEDYDAIGSDDVDSDDLEDEIIPGLEEAENAEVSQQHDYIQF